MSDQQQYRQDLTEQLRNVREGEILQELRRSVTFFEDNRQRIIEAVETYLDTCEQALTYIIIWGTIYVLWGDLSVAYDDNPSPLSYDLIVWRLRTSELFDYTPGTKIKPVDSWSVGEESTSRQRKISFALIGQAFAHFMADKEEIDSPGTWPALVQLMQKVCIPEQSWLPMPELDGDVEVGQANQP